MKVTHCEHPRLVYNKYLGKKVLASCGKCAVCTTERKKRWISRIINESKCWKFTRVIHLDYNDKFIPRYELGEDEYLYEVQQRFYRRKHNELDFQRNNIKLSDFEDIFSNLEIEQQNNERNYLYNRIYNHRLGLPHVDVRDIQDWAKRLNTYFKRYVTGEWHNFRICYAAEYGETTFRPHYHLLLFFNDSRVAETLPLYASKAWSDGGNLQNPYGHCKVELDRGHAASYISKYITKFADIPKCYSHSRLSTFFVASRRPPLGMLLQSVEEIQAIFNSRSCTRVKPQECEGVTRPVVVPLETGFESRCFPKPPLYSSLPANVRIELTRSAVDSRDFSSFVAKCFLRCVKVDDFGLLDLEDNKWYLGIGDIKCNLSDKTYLLNVDIGKFVKDSFLCSRLDFVILRMTECFTKFHFLLSFYYVGRHIDWLHKQFNIPVDRVIRNVDSYYRKRELRKLGLFYKLQQQLLLDGSVEDWRCFYPLTFLEGDQVSPNDCKVAKFYLSDCVSFKIRDFQARIKSNYLSSLKEKDYELFNLIKTYFYAKKCDEDAQALTHAWA